MKESDYVPKIKEYESNFKKFMNINLFPQYNIYEKKYSTSLAYAQGYDSIAKSHYDLSKRIHSLTISVNKDLCEYIIFHEFTHILDSEMYVNNDPARYMGLSGFTEYHASQVALAFLLGAQSINDISNFSMNKKINTIYGVKSVKQYILERQQEAIELFKREDFPSSIETLKSSIGVIYNYWGLRSICKMYAIDYNERVDNDYFLKYIPTSFFAPLNHLMQGWLSDSSIEKSIILYINIFGFIASQYRLI